MVQLRALEKQLSKTEISTNNNHITEQIITIREEANDTGKNSYSVKHEVGYLKR